MNFRVVLWLFGWCLVSRFCLETLGLKAVQENWIPAYPGIPSPSGFWNIWLRFDSDRYLEIIKNGYHKGYLGPPGWFPGYPFTVRPFALILDAKVAAIVVSNLALVVSLYLLYTLVLENGESERAAKRTVLLLLAFPSAFILSTVYSESLFLVTALASFLCAHRGKWRAAVLWASGACLIRLAGLALLPAILLICWPQLKRSKRELAWLCLPFSGVLLFFVHLHFTVGDFFAYFKIQGVYSKVLGVWPALSQGRPLWLEHQVGLSFLALEVLVLVCIWTKLKVPYRVYIVLSIFMGFYHIQGTCSHRFALALFPWFMGLEKRLSKFGFFAVLALFWLAQIILFIMWVRGYRSTY